MPKTFQRNGFYCSIDLCNYTTSRWYRQLYRFFREKEGLLWEKKSIAHYSKAVPTLKFVNVVTILPYILICLTRPYDRMVSEASWDGNSPGAEWQLVGHASIWTFITAVYIKVFRLPGTTPLSLSFVNPVFLKLTAGERKVQLYLFTWYARCCWSGTARY